MQPIKNHVVVSLESEYVEKIGRFYTDPASNPTEFATTDGVITKLPAGSSIENRNNMSKLEVGDRVVFSYKLIDISGGYTRKIKEATGLFVLPLRWIFLAIKPDGRIVMMDDWLLGEKVYSDDTEDLVDENGHTVKVTLLKSGLCVPSKPLPNQATIIADSEEVLVGKRVFHRDSTGAWYNIPGLGDKLVIERELVYGYFTD